MGRDDLLGTQCLTSLATGHPRAAVAQVPVLTCGGCKAPSNSSEHGYGEHRHLEWRKCSGGRGIALLRLCWGGNWATPRTTMVEQGERRGITGSKFCVWPSIGRVHADRQRGALVPSGHSGGGGSTSSAWHAWPISAVSAAVVGQPSAQTRRLGTTHGRI